MTTEVIKDRFTIVRPSESIDLTNVKEFREALDSAIADSPEGLIMDLSNAMYMDSAGMQAVVHAYQRIHKLERKVALVVANRNMREIIGVVNLDMLPGMYIREDMASAAQALAGR